MAVFSLTFVRHGETTYNRKNIIQGQTDVPLSAFGEKQAQLVGTRLQNDTFTHIFSSDLLRASETAKIIAEANRVTKCEIIHDKRLRERKFGSAEGKTSKELIQAAKKAKRKYIDYTPPGGETIEQVQERVKSFFSDICKLAAEWTEAEEMSGMPAQIKRRHGGSLGHNSRPSKRLELSGRSQSFCGAKSIQSILNQMNYNPDFEDSDLESNLASNDQFMQHTDRMGNTTSDFSFLDCNGSSSEGLNINNDLVSSSDSLSGTSQESGCGILSYDSDSDSTVSGQPVLGSSPVTAGTLPVFQTPSPVRPACCDLSISSLGNPNVSLSPIKHQRLSSISSISSGRNSSFDEFDSLHVSTPEILVVSHGGFVKESIRYFVETLNCKITGKSLAFKVCPNCSLSKFTVQLDDFTGKPSLTCVTLHDKDHLIGLEMPDAEGCY